jgi:regulator of protease activity HflC (stomatin/prohibitin superfamily)
MESFAMTDIVTGMNTSKERRASTTSGYVILLVMLALLGTIVWRFYSFNEYGPTVLGAFMLLGSFLTLLFLAPGFYMIQPNQGRAITLFGAYYGTDRTAGLRWVWPWMGRKRISMRANPIEMAAQVVWRVVDTAQALYDVDDYRAFVVVQIEAAVRTIGSRYPYDDFSHAEVTLRGNHDQVGAELRAELIARLQTAGITVDECGFTHLAYAQEIAGAMLRRQQAEAVVAARKTMVEGAVGMVEMALDLLNQKQVVQLDDERKAAMVSNLMVVLCGDRDTQPVVNAGSLYQ